MQKRLMLALFVILSMDVCFAQSIDQSMSQSGTPQNNGVDCSDPSMEASPACNGTQAQGSSSNRGTSSNPVRTPVLTNPLGLSPDQYSPGTPPPNPSQVPRSQTPTRPETEFEQMVADSVGRALPLFGQSLFVQAPSTFSPVDWMQVPSDYIIGPGDELQIAVWGQVEANLRVVVDRSGQIYIPQVGQISVAGIHYGNLEQHLKAEISKVFKNFTVTANIGRLRSIQVVVVGYARYPGTYTISSLSTLVNAIFASGGPAPQGSLRHIQVRRDGATITDFDFYDLLVKGDKSKDVRLQPGDVLYIPHVGPLVAISGSVNTPAIYEMKEDSTLKDLIEVAGDLSTIADTNKIMIDRFVEHKARRTLEFPYDEQSRALPLQDGDIVRVFSIVPRFESTVTLRGNVANPGRYPWKPGMRVRDLIPDAQALLTRRYWRNRAAIVSGRATEYPINPQGFPNNRSGLNQQPKPDGNATPEIMEATEIPNSAQNVPQGTVPSNVPNGIYAQNPQSSSAGQPSNSANPAGTPTQSQTPGLNPNPNIVKNVAEDLRSYAPEINWDYAIIQRVNPVDLTSKLLWMSPRKAILEQDEESNLELQPGDIVTIFSQRDISVPQTERSQYVIVEGEVVRAGVYKLETNETLRSVLQRAGGLTANAYVYGSQLTRESARIDQQKSLDELAHTMEVQIRQSAVAVAASTNPGDLPQMLAAQEAIIAQLRNTRASGRVALPVRPKDKNLTDFPNMVLEDSDRLTIPHIPSTVSVVGDVYNPGSFIFEPRNSAGAYLAIAGKGKPQSDLHHAFVLRANGVVVAANNVNGLFTGTKFDRIRLYPGDQIVVPYKLPTGAFVRGLRDWTQITSQLAFTGAALAVILP
ncbi:MAG: Capsular polysaccharide export system protein KpsC [Candidatus Sulfotelmatobacter sp.]|nr:Capsular polysaccharide export system protein KpsC [Candidatus Sulfotelmatobacter sp.]